MTETAETETTTEGAAEWPTPCLCVRNPVTEAGR